MGRRSREINLARVEALAAEGASQKRAAHELGFHELTFSLKLRDREDVAAAWKRGRKLQAEAKAPEAAAQAARKAAGRAAESCRWSRARRVLMRRQRLRKTQPREHSRVINNGGFL